MRNLAFLFPTLVFAACWIAPVQRSESRPVDPLDSVVQFLLASAANDFLAHRPPDPVRFRDVHLGHVTGGDGTVHYMLCGEFLPAEQEGKAGWTPFATIKTSGYEQWLGTQATNFCADSSVVWDEVGDLSDSLRNRLDALR